jgi:hypothetical protein
MAVGRKPWTERELKVRQRTSPRFSEDPQILALRSLELIESSDGIMFQPYRNGEMISAATAINSRLVVLCYIDYQSYMGDPTQRGSERR